MDSTANRLFCYASLVVYSGTSYSDYKGYAVELGNDVALVWQGTEHKSWVYYCCQIPQVSGNNTIIISADTPRF